MYVEHRYTGFEPLDACDVIYGGYFEHRLLHSGHGRMRHERLMADGIQLETGSYSFPVVAQGSLPRDAFCIGFVASGADTTRYNTALNRDDELQIYPPGAELLYHAARASCWVAFTAQGEMLQRIAVARTGKPLALPSSAIASVRLCRGGRDSLSRIVRHALAIARTFEATGGLPPDQSAALGHALLNSYVDALAGSDLSAGTGQTTAAARHHQIILACERFMKSGDEPEIALAEVARRCGYSLRALELIFQRSVEMTPGMWFSTIRLNGALRDLIGGGPDCTVAGTARRWGFRHLSRFAQQYRASFGELPSETLRRSSQRY